MHGSAVLSIAVTSKLIGFLGSLVGPVAGSAARTIGSSITNARFCSIAAWHKALWERPKPAHAASRDREAKLFETMNLLGEQGLGATFVADRIP